MMAGVRKKVPMKIAAATFVLFICLLGAYALGLRNGAEAFLGFDSPYRAALTVANLKRLDSGDIDDLKESLEFDLDSHIYSYGIYANSAHSWAFPELADPCNVENAMWHVVSYRRSNLSQPMDQAVVNALSKEEKQLMIEQDRLIHDVLVDFGLEGSPNKAKRGGRTKRAPVCEVMSDQSESK